MQAMTPRGLIILYSPLVDLFISISICIYEMSFFWSFIFVYFCTSFLKMVEIAVGRLSNSICTLVPKVHIELFKSPLLL